jgi:CarD family transcriptional regulator
MATRKTATKKAITPKITNGAGTNGTTLSVVHEFKAGDKVVYPAHGVGVVDNVELRKISGCEHKFYSITILETGMKIMVPTGQCQTVGLRKVVDIKTVDKVYDILKDRSVTIDNQTWNRRYREYTQKIKTGSVLEIASVIRELSVLKSDKELSFGEKRMLDTAQGLLVKEISIAKARPESTIKAELSKICQVSL